MVLILTSKDANTEIKIKSEDNENIICFTPSKTYSSIIISSPDLKTGNSYEIYSNNNNIGTINISEFINNFTEEGASNFHNGNRPGGFSPDKSTNNPPPQQNISS